MLAERLASSGKRILLCDRRPHIAGNTFDLRNEAGILIHTYGPHIFHTNSEEVFAYLSRFTRWRPYEHRVLASAAGKLLPIPINRTTLNGLYGLDLKGEADAGAFLASRAEPVADIRDLTRRGHFAGGYRPLPDLLRRLYAQAMGPRSVASSTNR